MVQGAPLDYVTATGGSTESWAPSSRCGAIQHRVVEVALEVCSVVPQNRRPPWRVALLHFASTMPGSKAKAEEHYDRSLSPRP